MLTALRGAAAVLACLAVAAAGVVPAAAVPNTADDVLTVLGEDVSVGHRETLQLRGPFSLGVSDTDYDWVEVSAGDLEDRASFRLYASSADGRLAPGRHATRRHADAGHVGLDVTVQHLGCNQSAGTVDVLDLTRDADGRLTGLAFDYAVTCESDAAPLRGSFRWNTDVPYQHTQVGRLTLPDTASGLTARGRVTLTNTGLRSQTYGPTSWVPSSAGGAGQAPVTVVRDGCTGVVLAPGGACTVDVSVTPSRVGTVDGHLRTPDGTARGAALSPVTMRVVPAPTSVVLTSTPQRGGIRLSTSAYHPSYRVLRSAGGGPETEVARDVPMPWTDTTVAVGTPASYRVVPRSGGAEGPVSDAATTAALPVPVGAEGTFVPVDPVRVLDTRDGTGAPVGPLGPGGTLRLDLAASGAIPGTGVSAVLLNVTGTQPTAVTHVRVWPAGEPRPETSSLNLVPGQSRPNQVVVPVGEDGEVLLSNNVGSTHLVVDLQGFYSDAAGLHGGGYHPVDPDRVLDTRLDAWPLGPGERVWLPVSAPGVDWTTVAAVDVTLTVTGPTGAGHLTAWAGDVAPPDVSNANFAPGQTIANHAVVPVSFDEDGEPGIALENSAGTTHVIVDIQGWYDDDARADGLRFMPTPTARVADTRAAPGRRPLPPGGTLVVPASVLPPALAHVVNVTATEGLGGGHLTVWDGTDTPPWTSAVNFARGEDSPNLATARTGRDGRVAVTAGSSQVHVVVDHLGYFY